MASRENCLKTIIDNWLDEPYMTICIWQNEDLRFITEKLDDMNEKEKKILKTYVIGLLKPINNLLLDKYSVVDYLSGIDNLCKYYHNYISDCDIVIKKSWVSTTHRKKFV